MSGQRRAFEYEPIECRECKCEFNLAYQNYYDRLCPACREKHK